MKKQRHGYFPDDCWELIFQKLREDDERDLHSVSLVSKRSLSISNWVKHSLKLNDKTIPLLPNLLQRFRHIESIVIDDTDSHNDIDGVVHQISQSGVLNLQAITFSSSTEPPRDGFKALALNKNMKNKLKVLDCSGLISIQDNDLVLIADCFPRLEELRISASDYMCDDEVAAHITDDGVEALASKLKELKRIDFEGNTCFITDQSLISLSTNCVKLREINLRIYGGGLVTEDGVDFVVPHSPNLTSLLLQLRSLQPSTFSFTIGNPFTHAKNLHSLTMFQELVTDKRICLVAKARPPLKKFELMGFMGRYPEIHGALKLLLQACQSTLKELTLGAWSLELEDTGIADLAPYLSNLTSIDLHEHFHLTCVTFCTLTKYCPSLQKLMMGLMGKYARGQEIDTLSQDYTHKNYRMRHLDICETMWLNDSTLINFGRVSDVFGRYSDDHSVLLNLKTLKACGTEIDDNGMAMSGTRCRNLRYLDIGNCKKVTDKGVMEVVRNCQRLRDIILDDCEKVSSCTLPLMLLSRPSLRNIDPPCIDDLNKQLINCRFLNIGYCEEVTRDGVKEVVRKCKELRVLNVRGCPNVGIGILDWMVISRPPIALKEVFSPCGFPPPSEDTRNLFLCFGCWLT
ncbi:hypothetical protein RHSIM_Rhsim01G0030700 [Rhododendron simsii]|uniref:F-box domain-containing protein n=1 Tax=Rhododendron simsii TaxID=118357 RepID=A0A834LZ45_RHOSS|nr:hypothetical protein RHSIM_Rhsim01G0030700 [Rhododendron simsii]